VALQVREGRGQPVAVEVALGLVGLMRVESTAVLAKAMVAQVGMLRQRALLAWRGLMQRDSYLHLITMLLTGGVVVVAAAAAVVVAAGVAARQSKTLPPSVLTNCPTTTHKALHHESLSWRCEALQPTPDTTLTFQ